MSKVKYGIKDTKEVLEFGYSGYHAFTQANADGDVNFFDFKHFVPVIMNAGEAINGIKNLKNELLDIDDTEQAELVALTKKYYSHLDDAECVELIEETIDQVINNVQVAVKWAKRNRPVAA